MTLSLVLMIDKCLNSLRQNTSLSAGTASASSRKTAATGSSDTCCSRRSLRILPTLAVVFWLSCTYCPFHQKVSQTLVEEMHEDSCGKAKTMRPRSEWFSHEEAHRKPSGKEDTANATKGSLSRCRACTQSGESEVYF